MKPLLDVLVILDALEKGAFAAASAKLLNALGAESYTIHRPESDLNIQLLDRSGHRARLPQRTDAAGERAGGAAIARELEIRAVKLQQGWEETAFVWRWTAPSRGAALAANRGIYQQQPLTRLHFTLNPSCWTGGR